MGPPMDGEAFQRRTSREMSTTGGPRKLGLLKAKRRDLSLMGDSQEQVVPPPPPPPPAPPEKKTVKDKPQALSDVIRFQKQKLKRTKTREKLFLPSKEEMTAERSRQEMLNKLQKFNKGGLRHIVVKEKIVLPSKEDLEQERTMLKLPKTIAPPVTSPSPPPAQLPSRTPGDGERPKRILKIKMKSQNSVDGPRPPPPPPPPPPSGSGPPPPPPPPMARQSLSRSAEQAKANVLKSVVGFKKENLKRTKTRENLFLPTKEVVSAERAHQELLNKLNNFNKRKLNHIMVKEKVVLPSKEDMMAERQALRLPQQYFSPLTMPPPSVPVPKAPQLPSSHSPPANNVTKSQQQPNNDVMASVTGFKKDRLKRTNTLEKIFLPTKEVVNAERAHHEVISNLQGFNRRKLRHVVPKEKSVLPTKEDLEEERKRMRLQPLVVPQSKQLFTAGEYDEIEDFVANLDIDEDDIDLDELSDV